MFYGHLWVLSQTEQSGCNKHGYERRSQTLMQSWCGTVAQPFELAVAGQIKLAKHCRDKDGNRRCQEQENA